jgi:hypothetical protein
VAMTTLARLSTTPARPFAQALARRHGLPWKIVLLIDRTLPHRASLHAANATTVTHGQGSVIGHPGTTIGLLLGDRRLPLPPMPCSRKRYGQGHGLAYHSGPERVGASLRTLDLEDSRGSYDRRAVLVLAARGDDHTKSAPAIAAKGWHCSIALGKTRSGTSAARSLTPSHARQWCHLDTFFRRHRRRTWQPTRLATPGNTRQRMDVRVRPPSGSVRDVGKGELVCSERRNRPDGRRQYLAGKDRRATARQMVRGYRRRWVGEPDNSIAYKGL